MIETKIKKAHLGHIKKGCFLNKTTRTSRATSNTYNSNFMRTHHYRVKQVVVKRKILECLRVGEKVILWLQTKKWEEEIKIPKCSRKSHVETVNEESKESSSEAKEIRIPKCRRLSRADNMNK